MSEPELPGPNEFCALVEVFRKIRNRVEFTQNDFEGYIIKYVNIVPFRVDISDGKRHVRPSFWIAVVVSLQFRADNESSQAAIEVFATRFFRAT